MVSAEQIVAVLNIRNSWCSGPVWKFLLDIRANTPRGHWARTVRHLALVIHRAQIPWVMMHVDRVFQSKGQSLYTEADVLGQIGKDIAENYRLAVREVKYMEDPHFPKFAISDERIQSVTRQLDTQKAAEVRIWEREQAAKKVARTVVRGISRAMQADLDREFNEKFQKWEEQQ